MWTCVYISICEVDTLGDIVQMDWNIRQDGDDDSQNADMWATQHGYCSHKRPAAADEDMRTGIKSVKCTHSSAMLQPVGIRVADAVEGADGGISTPRLIKDMREINAILAEINDSPYKGPDAIFASVLNKPNLEAQFLYAPVKGAIDTLFAQSSHYDMESTMTWVLLDLFHLLASVTEYTPSIKHNILEIYRNIGAKLKKIDLSTKIRWSRRDKTSLDSFFTLGYVNDNKISSNRILLIVVLLEITRLLKDDTTFSTFYEELCIALEFEHADQKKNKRTHVVKSDYVHFWPIPVESMQVLYVFLRGSKVSPQTSLFAIKKLCVQLCLKEKDKSTPAAFPSDESLLTEAFATSIFISERRERSILRLFGSKQGMDTLDRVLHTEHIHTLIYEGGSITKMWWGDRDSIWWRSDMVCPVVRDTTRLGVPIFRVPKHIGSLIVDDTDVLHTWLERSGAGTANETIRFLNSITYAQYEGNTEMRHQTMRVMLYNFFLDFYHEVDVALYAYMNPGGANGIEIDAMTTEKLSAEIYILLCQHSTRLKFRFENHAGILDSGDLSPRAMRLATNAISMITNSTPVLRGILDKQAHVDGQGRLDIFFRRFPVQLIADTLSSATDRRTPLDNARVEDDTMYLEESYVFNAKWRDVSTGNIQAISNLSNEADRMRVAYAVSAFREVLYRVMEVIGHSEDITAGFLAGQSNAKTKSAIMAARTASKYFSSYIKEGYRIYLIRVNYAIRSEEINESFDIETMYIGMEHVRL